MKKEKKHGFFVLWVAGILFVIPIVCLVVSVVLAAIPFPPLPPYQPVPMNYVPGVSGLVVYSNTNGVALIDPRNHTISPVLLNEFDYTTIDPDTGEPVGGKLGSEGGGRFDVAMTSNGLQALISNFGDSKVFFIDLSSGTPVVAGMAKIDMFAEDIAIDPTNTVGPGRRRRLLAEARRPPYPDPYMGSGRGGPGDARSNQLSNSH